MHFIPMVLYCIVYSLTFMISFEFHTQNGNLQLTSYSLQEMSTHFRFRVVHGFSHVSDTPNSLSGWVGLSATITWILGQMNIRTDKKINRGGNIRHLMKWKHTKECWKTFCFYFMKKVYSLHFFHTYMFVNFFQQFISEQSCVLFNPIHPSHTF